MTILGTYVPDKYVVTAGQVDFNIAFEFVDKADIAAVMTTELGVDTLLVNGVDFTVSGATLTTAVQQAVGDQLTIYLDMPFTQTTDYKNTGDLDLDNIEDDYDTAALERQQLNEADSRNVQIPITDDTDPDDFYAALLLLIEQGEQAGVILQTDEFTGDGVTTDFSITAAPPNAASLLITIGGIVQSESYTVSGTTLSFDAPPPDGVQIFSRNIGYQVPVATDSVVHVQTINDLRNLSIAATSAVQVLGYYAEGDGGGGPIRTFQAGQAPGYYVDNGGSIIVPTGGDGSGAWLWDDVGYVNAEWFGAKGDCAWNDADTWSGTDDSAAWQKAIDYASTGSPKVVHGSRMYQLNSGLSIKSSGVGIVFPSAPGATFGSTENRYRATGFAIGANITGNVIEFLDTDNLGKSISGNILKNVFLYGNNRAYTVSGAGVAILSAYVGDFQNVHIFGINGTGLRIGGCVKATFSGINLSACGAAEQPSFLIEEYTNAAADTLFLQGSHIHAFNIEDDYSTGSVAAGMYIDADGAKGCKFSSFTFENSSAVGGVSPLLNILAEFNIFSDFTLNRNIAATLVGTTAHKMSVSGDNNQFSNLFFRSAAQGQRMLSSTGDNNSFNGVKVQEQTSHTTSDGVEYGGIPIWDTGDSNLFSAVSIVDGHGSTFAGLNTVINGYDVVKVSEVRADNTDWSEAEFDYTTITISGSNITLNGYNETGFAYVGVLPTMVIQGKRHIISGLNIEVQDAARAFTNQPVDNAVVSVSARTSKIMNGFINGLSKYKRGIDSLNRRNDINYNTIFSVTNDGIFFGGSNMESLSCIGNSFTGVGDGGASDALIQVDTSSTVFDEAMRIIGNGGHANNVQNLITCNDDATDAYMWAVITGNAFGSNTIGGTAIDWLNGTGNNVIANNIAG